MICRNKYNSVVAVDVEGEQGLVRTSAVNNQNLPSDVRPTNSDKDIQNQVTQFLKLVDALIKRRRTEEDDIDKIRTILGNNRKLINYQHCKDNKLRSLLHIIKFNVKLPYIVKQKIVNTIIDTGYELFSFSEHNDISDNSHSFFFAAAKGDYTKLVEIVEHFKNTGNEASLHDTKEGDTVLSFMIKFGDLTQERFLNCFTYLLKQNIDSQRIDYYKNNILDIIESEKLFLNKIGNRGVEIEILDNIADIIIHSNVTYEHRESYYGKYELFRSLIERDKRFKTLLINNSEHKDSNDGENTLLQLAIIKNNVEITKLLLTEGADPNGIVVGRNEEIPLILAAKLYREDIFIEILRNRKTLVTEDMYIKFITTEIKPKFFNYLLESNNLDVDLRYNEKTPLYYAIVRKNKKAVQSLLQRRAKLDDNCLNNINPKDLEEYLNSCIRFDNFKDDMEESVYKVFIVLDFFMSPATTLANDNYFHKVAQPSEIVNIRNIGSNKRLKHLLEHPLICIFIFLKWHCIVKYYYCFAFIKFMFYFFIGLIVYCVINWLLFPVVAVQFLIVYFNYLEFGFKFKQYTLHFILEIVIFLLLITICILTFVPDAVNAIKEVSAFIIILTSLSILLTLGYHISLSKWMSMAKRVFKNFGILLLFFLLPILAFSIAFNLLLPFQKSPKEDSATSIENEDFVNIPRAIFRTFILLSGDIGDKQFSLLGGYVLFLFFSIGMAIILLNFWTGVAVSDIKEIEEQSIVVAFNNVIVFIDGVERIYNFLVYKLLKLKICEKLPEPFLESKIRLGKKEKMKFFYGIHLFINDENQFKNNEEFRSLKLDDAVVSKLKALYDDKDLNVTKTLKQLIEKIDTIDDTNRHMYQYLQTVDSHLKKIEQLLESES